MTATSYATIRDALRDARRRAREDKHDGRAACGMYPLADGRTVWVQNAPASDTGILLGVYVYYTQARAGACSRIRPL